MKNKLSDSISINLLNTDYNSSQDFSSCFEKLNQKHTWNFEKQQLKFESTQPIPEELKKQILTQIAPITSYKNNHNTILEYINPEKRLSIIKEQCFEEQDIEKLKEITLTLVHDKPSNFQGIGLNFKILKDFSSEQFSLINDISKVLTENYLKTSNKVNAGINFVIEEENFIKQYKIAKINNTDNTYIIIATYHFNYFKDESSFESTKIIVDEIVDKFDEYYKDFKDISSKLLDSSNS